jgi:hypothetical protein
MVKGQLDRDAKLVGLVKTMEDVYSFVEASDSFKQKVQLLEETIEKILKQTVECAIFIREYTGHGFGGELITYARISMIINISTRPTREADVRG